MSSNSLNNGDLNFEIRRQLEYYFGDKNLSRDNFLQNEMKKDNGWVSLDLLLTFNRLKCLTTEKAAVISAVKDSKIVDISNDAEKVRRNPDVRENDLVKEAKANTLYAARVMESTKNRKCKRSKNTLKKQSLKVSGLPTENINFDLIKDFFNNYVPAPSVHYEYGTLYYKQGSSEAILDFRTVKENGAVKALEMMKEAAKETDGKIQFYGHTIECKVLGCKEKKKCDTHCNVKFLKGNVMHVSGLPNKSVNIALLKEFFNKYGSIEHVFYEEGSSEAILEFDSTKENAAIKALKLMNESANETDGKIKFQGQEIQCKIYEGEEEKKYWTEKNTSKCCSNRKEIIEKLAENVLQNPKKPKVKEAKANTALINQKDTDKAQSVAKFLKGQILHVSGLPTKNVDFHLLKDFFNKYGTVAYAAYEEGSSEANIRFYSKEENAAVKALELMNEAAKEADGKVQFQGHDIQCKVLEGEEEEKYWAEKRLAKNNRRFFIVKNSKKYKSEVETEAAKNANNAGVLNSVFGAFDYFKGMIWDSNQSKVNENSS